MQGGCLAGLVIHLMSSNPLVSVITIFLNAEKFIQEAVESVFGQTYNNWELLLVDDGSTDKSTEIALNYARRYPDKVRYLEHNDHQNCGKSASRNLGVSKAKGEHIAFLDADDVWLPQKLERQVAILDSWPEAAMVCGPTQWWYSWTGNPEDVQLDYIREISTHYNILFEPPRFFTLLLRNKARPPAICAILVRRWLFQIAGGFEEISHGMYEDQAFYMKAFLRAPVFVSSECWDRYRQHPNSSCAVAMKLGLYHPEMPNIAHLNFLNWLKEYLSKQGIDNREIWLLLRKKFLRYRYSHLFRLLNYGLKFMPRKWFEL